MTKKKKNEQKMERFVDDVYISPKARQCAARRKLTNFGVEKMLAAKKSDEEKTYLVFHRNFERTIFITNATYIFPELFSCFI